ncbi:hypothetical protein OVA24_09700 [Luteolibacter sp. SL250]|uniref:hypothetical protein n=1 Tax=Luteolibacter sp. SL250 TaxID=2995170 RepID=UPI00226E2415|nr:hypothetical protein [Luteolibacter sp. SL250]WAC21658.1 hypothetical protein OVA24_09700 [Luteolibacter sp. SL250]
MAFIPKTISQLIAVFIISAGAASAATITINNPVRVGGSDAIDPTDAKEVGDDNASGSTPQSVLEALPGFGAIQSFGGFTGNSTTANEYIFDNIADTTLPDLRIIYTGEISSGVVAISNTTFSTSPSSSMRLPGAGTGLYGMSIQLGSWNGTTLTTGTDLGVSAFGFTLSGRFGQVNSVTFTYYDALNNVLSTQVAPDTGVSDNATAAVYSGYQITSGQNAISRVEISVNPISTSSNGLFGLDDIGFTPTVPEPSALVLAAGALPLCWLRRRKAA